MITLKVPDLSVVIASYRESELSKTLAILDEQRQGLQLDIELIVVFEGVSPSLTIRPDSLAVKNIEGNYGAAAKDLGLNICRGEYVVFCDDDNIYYDNFLESCYESAYGYDIGLVQCYHHTGNSIVLIPECMPTQLGHIDTMCMCVRADFARLVKWNAYQGKGTDWRWYQELLKYKPRCRLLPIVVGEHTLRPEYAQNHIG